MGAMIGAGAEAMVMEFEAKVGRAVPLAEKWDREDTIIIVERGAAGLSATIEAKKGQRRSP